jgi:hypothetical protein
VTPPESIDERAGYAPLSSASVLAIALPPAAAAAAATATKTGAGAMPSALLHALVEAGVQQTWNNELDVAVAALTRGADYSPRHALHLAEVALVRQAITGRLKERDRLLAALDRVDALLPTISRHPDHLVRAPAPYTQRAGFLSWLLLSLLLLLLLFLGGAE